jgi:hypothetical protein
MLANLRHHYFGHTCHDCDPARYRAHPDNVDRQIIGYVRLM